MKICLAQLNYHIGDFELNVSRIQEVILRAKKASADVVIFSELAVCGYPPRDFLEFKDFLGSCMKAIEKIARESRGIAVIVGSPSANPAEKGKPLYNSAFFLADGGVKDIAHKTLLPNYDVFDEYRYFEPNRLPYSTIEFRGVKFALTICEDLWNIGDDPLYVRSPMDELAKLNPDVIINIAASPFNYTQPVTRRGVLCMNAKKYRLPVFYVNHVGGQTELLFDGGSMVVNSSGDVVEELHRFREDFRIVDLNEILNPASPIPHPESPILNPSPALIPATTHIALIHDALVMGIRDYFAKMGFSKAILGLSGGIDSAVTLALAAEALGGDNVRAILLPSRFSSDHSISDALELAINLGVPYDIIPISGSVDAVEHTLEPYFKELPFNLAEENIQARMRAVILMALSNKFGYILLNTSNKSEAAVGYGTLYGDMCGGLSVLGDVYKTQVYELAGYINREGTVIPVNSINKPPSAELRPEQKDSDSLPEYGVLDKILFSYIEERMGPEDLVLQGFDRDMVQRVLRLVNTSEYKRHQSPPILRVSPKAFGMGRRMPIVARYLY
jgi:NAD+ synthase (glutamine-hydrolysing)